MRDYALTDGRAKALIYDAFDAGVMPLRLFPQVFVLCFRDDIQRAKFGSRSLRSVLQAFTEAVKMLTLAPRHDTGVRIGRHFAELHWAEPEPVAVIDGVEVFEA